MSSLYITERLEKELRELLPAHISEGIRVIPPPFGTDSAWFGAKMISNVRTASPTLIIDSYHQFFAT